MRQGRERGWGGSGLSEKKPNGGGRVLRDEPGRLGRGNPTSGEDPVNGEPEGIGKTPEDRDGMALG